MRWSLPSAVVAMLLSVAAAAEPAADRCAVPDDFTYSDVALPRVSAALAEKSAITVVVVGTASTAGAGVSKPGQTYPARLGEELTRLMPKARFVVIVKAKRGQRARDQVATLAREVIGSRPTLVIWQTGTVDAVRTVDPSEFGDALLDGIDLLHGNGADVILMDMQYSPQTAAVINFLPYIDYMRRIAASRKVIVFDRYDIMQYWVGEGAIGFAASSKTKQAADAEFVHGCLARLLALTIDAAVGGRR